MTAPARLTAPVSRELPVDDVERAAAFYCNTLGFMRAERGDDHSRAAAAEVVRDAARLILYADRAVPQSATIYFETDDRPHTDVAAGLAHYRDILGFRVNYAQPDLAVMDRDTVGVLLVQPWGLRDFRVLDLEDNELVFGQPFE